VTVSRAEKAREKVRCAEGSRSRAYRSEQSELRGKPESVTRQTEAVESPSSESAPEVTSFIELRLGGRLWKPPFSVKAREGVIRESSDRNRVLVSCRWLQKSERGIFPFNGEAHREAHASVWSSAWSLEGVA
jgi:hypothetical protein